MYERSYYETYIQEKLKKATKKSYSDTVLIKRHTDFYNASKNLDWRVGRDDLGGVFIFFLAPISAFIALLHFAGTILFLWNLQFCNAISTLLIALSAFAVMVFFYSN